MALLDQLLVRIDATTEQLRRELAAADAAVGKTQGSIDRRLGALEGRFARLGAGISGALRGGLTTLIGTFGTREILQFADSFNQVQNALRVSGTAEDELAGKTQKLFDISSRTRAPITDMAQLYQQLSLQTRDLGLSQEQLFRFLETTGKAIATSGTSSEAASGALRQLGQALGQTVVRAEEFNSLQEGLPVLMRAAAAGIDRAGGSVSRLGQLIRGQQITAAQLFEGISKGAGLIDDAFSRMSPTIEQAGTHLRNALTLFIGSITDAAGATGGLVGALDTLAAAIESPQTIAQATQGVEDIIAAYKAWQSVATDLAGTLKILGQLSLAGRLGQGLGQQQAPGATAEQATATENTRREAENAAAAIKRLNEAAAQLQAGNIEEALQALIPPPEIAVRLREITIEIVALQTELALLGTGQSPIDRLFGSGRQADELTARIAQLREEAGRLSQLDTAQALANLIPPPEAGDRFLTVLRQINAEGETTGQAVAPQASKLDQTIDKLQRQAQLLRETKLTQQQINAILTEEFRTSAQGGQIFAELGNAERTRLTAAIANLDVAERERDLADEVAKLRQANVVLQLPTEDLRSAAEAALMMKVNLDAARGSSEGVADALASISPEARKLINDYVRLKTEAAQIKLGEDLAGDLAQQKLINQFAGQETEEFRIQQQLLQIKLQTHLRDVSAYEDEVRAIQHQITLQRDLNALREQRRQAAETRGQIGEAINPADVISQFALGTATEQTRVTQQLAQQRPMWLEQGLSPQAIASLEEGVRQQEALNTQLAITQNVAPAVSSSLADLAETLLFEGSDAAGKQLIQTMLRLQLQLAADLATALLLRSALGGGPGGQGWLSQLLNIGGTAAVGAAGAGATGGGATVVSRTSTPIRGLASGGRTTFAPEIDIDRLERMALPGLAGGGRIEKGEPYQVGEAGRELVLEDGKARLMGTHGREVLIPQGETLVLPHRETERLLQQIKAPEQLERGGPGWVAVPPAMKVGAERAAERLPGLAIGGWTLPRLPIAADFEHGVAKLPGLARGGSTAPTSMRVPNVGKGGDTTVNVGPPVINIIDQRPAGSPPIEVQSQVGPDGRQVITALVRGAMSEMIRSGEYQAMNRELYGISPRAT